MSHHDLKKVVHDALAWSVLMLAGVMLCGGKLLHGFVALCHALGAN